MEHVVARVKLQPKPEEDPVEDPVPMKKRKTPCQTTCHAEPRGMWCVPPAAAARQSGMVMVCRPPPPRARARNMWCGRRRRAAVQ